MSKICKIIGKKPMTGNYRSHAMNAVKRKFLPNLQKHKFWVESKKCFVKFKLSTKAIRYIDKKGVETVLSNLKEKKEFKEHK